MRIAYFTPIPPSESGIARLSANIMPFLQDHADIDIFANDIHPFFIRSLNNDLSVNIYHHLRFETIQREKKYDSIIYNIGNSEYHAYMYKYLFLHKGLIFLHENVLHHSRAAYYLKSKDYLNYYKELLMNYSDDSEIFDIFRFVSTGIGDDSLYLKYPMSDLIIRRSAGIIVMNDYLKDLILTGYPDLPVKKIKLPFFDIDNRSDPITFDDKDTEEFNIGIFGMISHYKRIIPILKALRIFSINKKIKINIVGKPVYGLDLKNITESMNMDNVNIHGYLDYDRFLSLMRECHLILNLRYPSFGETSAALIDNLGMGKAVIIYDLESSREIPNDIVIKIKPSIEEESNLMNILRYYYNNKKELASIGKKARDYIRKYHCCKRSAREIIEFAKENQGKTQMDPDLFLYKDKIKSLMEIIKDRIRKTDISSEKEKELLGLWKTDDF